MVSLLQKSPSPYEVNGHTDRVLCLANHPTNPHEFVSSGWDNTLQVRVLVSVCLSGVCVFAPKCRQWTSANKCTNIA